MGRVAIGLGLMLLALHILLDTLAPAEDAPSVRALLKLITGDPIFCVLIATVLTWAAHSSVATVLLTMSLAFSHFVTPAAALALVLGANLGSAINPVLEGAHHGDPASYRLPLGNLINRLLGVCVALPFLQHFADMAQRFEPNMARLTAEFHVGFNSSLPPFSSRCSTLWHHCLSSCCPIVRRPSTLLLRAISMIPLWKRPRLLWQTRRARRFIWAIPSRRCSNRL